MSRGLGRVQNGCLVAIWEYERRGKSPTTLDIVGKVYGISPDADGSYWVTDAQHVAVKRALAGLQRKGQVIGLRRWKPHANQGGQYLDWMSAQRAQQWVREKAHAGRADVRAKMRAIGMKAPKYDPQTGEVR